MYTVGVIPAAGNGSRWGNDHVTGGIFKEMLPISVDQFDICYTLLDHTARAMWMGGANALVIVTNKAKVSTFARHLPWFDKTPTYYTIQRGDRDMWSAMIEACEFPADRYLFAMPDTLYPIDAFAKAPAADFTLGLFETDKPERFGVLHEDRVHNKSGRFLGKLPAWGLLTWSAACVEFWRENEPPDYTAAINAAIDRFGLHTWPLAYYRDMATFEDYQEAVCADIL